MPLKLAGEVETVQGLDEQGWLRAITAGDGRPGLKIAQSGAAQPLEVIGSAWGYGIVLKLAGQPDIFLSRRGSGLAFAASSGAQPFSPYDDGQADLGIDGVRWRNLYLSGAAVLGGDPEFKAGGRPFVASFAKADVGAGLASVSVPRLGGINVDWVALASGSVLGVTLRSSEARTAGTLTLRVVKNGVELDATLRPQLDANNTQQHILTRNKDVVSFAQGDVLGVLVDTSADWAPTTADVIVDLYVEV